MYVCMHACMYVCRARKKLRVHGELCTRIRAHTHTHTHTHTHARLHILTIIMRQRGSRASLTGSHQSICSENLKRGSAAVAYNRKEGGSYRRGHRRQSRTFQRKRGGTKTQCERGRKRDFIRNCEVAQGEEEKEEPEGHGYRRQPKGWPGGLRHCVRYTR